LQLSLVEEADKDRVDTITANVCAVPQPQELQACTVRFPEVPPAVTLIDVVPCPEFIVDPAGTTQL
jgi:hypothetical protein